MKLLRSAYLCWPDATWAWERHCGTGPWPSLIAMVSAGHSRSSPQPLPSLARRCQWLKQGGCWVGKVQIKQCVCWCVGRRGSAMLPTGCIFGPFKCPWDNYCRSALFVCLVCTSEQRTYETCVHALYRLISGRHDIVKSTNLWSMSRYHVIDMNHTDIQLQHNKLLQRTTYWQHKSALYASKNSCQK